MRLKQYVIIFDSRVLIVFYRILNASCRCIIISLIGAQGEISAPEICSECNNIQQVNISLVVFVIICTSLYIYVYLDLLFF